MSATNTKQAEQAAREAYARLTGQNASTAATASSQDVGRQDSVARIVSRAAAVEARGGVAQNRSRTLPGGVTVGQVLDSAKGH